MYLILFLEYNIDLKVSYSFEYVCLVRYLYCVYGVCFL